MFATVLLLVKYVYFNIVPTLGTSQFSLPCIYCLSIILAVTVRFLLNREMIILQLLLENWCVNRWSCKNTVPTSCIDGVDNEMLLACWYLTRVWCNENSFKSMHRVPACDHNDEMHHPLCSSRLAGDFLDLSSRSHSPLAVERVHQ
jgi:hypothetical protein